ncbi:hypothetical protein BN946_scf185007.g125 [Trametes cinnabarina]|uniref:Uncharacterized protein n=1 Tax=Pycnoporus cinnabarinus TaxID=5643 RepID=A0A060SFS1_PYCCI|nr:hypothetical protein BN946_scf185007.g125 [Trametes cinnabarina]
MDHRSDSEEGARDDAAQKKRPPSFMLDDAFSDNEDIDVPEFSPAAIREELAKNLNGADNWHVGDTSIEDLTTKMGFSVDPDASVSTFDIDAEHASLPSVSQSPSSPRIQSQSSSHQDSLYEVPLSSELSQVCLSDHQSPPPPQHGGPEEIPSEYPTVQIDLSAPEVIAKEVHPDRVPLDSPAPMSNPQYAASHEEFHPKSVPSPLKVPPANAGAASTSSLPLSSSTSLPTPTSSKLSEPLTPTIRHRPTRSAGPSMLDKVVSKTRPPHLPPKPRTEDRKHLHDWEEMMKRSRAAGEYAVPFVSRLSNENVY